MANQIVEVVGLTANNNYRSCANHHCCGQSLVLDSPNNGVGMRLRLRLTPRGELACHVICNDGTNGCCVGYTFEKLAENNGVALDGAIVEIFEVLTEQSTDSADRRKYWQNCGYALSHVVEYSAKGGES